MKNESYLKFLLSDNKSLRRYYRDKEAPKLEDVKRAVLLKVRDRRHSIPDHYYRLGLEYSFKDIKDFSQILTIGLPSLANEFLEIRKGKVYVQGNKFNEWQLLLPFIPPLLLSVALIWKELESFTNITEYVNRNLLPNFKFTALPPAFLPEMEMLKKELSGLNDLHIHLNGSVETDLAWQDFLKHPEMLYNDLLIAYHGNKVKEQIEQFTDGLTPFEFFDLFKIAGRLREWLCRMVFFGENIFDVASVKDLLMKISAQEDIYKEHPVNSFLSENTLPLVVEATLYVKTLDFLENNPQNQVVPHAFYYYLLILGLCNRMLVQQTDTFGFEQFQKYTTNGLREFSERTYHQRFLQMCGNNIDNIHHVEGRFSPKNTISKNLKIIKNITDGFDNLNRKQTQQECLNSKISLVAHFIKKPDTSRDEFIRHKSLRAELRQKTEALVATLNTKSYYSSMLVGVDAAASEFDTPPEVFASSFRKLRDYGVQHFTYHAGEDFFHILTGLRAIYEAMKFLDLKAGDRIGHASAAGVSVKLWRKNIGENLWIKREDYMDDLVFAYYLITSTHEKSLEHLLPIIALRVEEYATKIYRKSYNIYDLIEAWKIRYLDPERLDNENILKELQRKNIINKNIEEIYQYYHSLKGKDEGSEIISIASYDIFDEAELCILQKLLLSEMHHNQIIIETLPTSNVIIGHHHSFQTYHLYNWYKWSKEGLKIPAIVVGTDDAGIFATNIYNEYCHIYCMLVFDKGLSPNDAIDYIKSLNHNADIYRFN